MNFFSHLFELLKKNTWVTKLDIPGNYLGDAGVYLLIDLLKTNDRIIYLNLGSNGIQSQAIHDFL